MQSPTAHHPTQSSALRGFFAGLVTVGFLGVALLPARLGRALVGHGEAVDRVENALAGTLLDLSGIVYLLTPMVALLALGLPLVLRPLRGARWQQLSGPLLTLPLGFGLWVLTVVVQEVKSERGSFPTMFDLAEGGSNAAFVEGSVGFLKYARIWQPAVVGVVLLGAAMVWLRRRHDRRVLPWKPWAAGLASGLFLATVVALAGAKAQASVNRFSPAALGDPLTGLVESSFDLLRHQGPATPRELVLTAELPPKLAATGAQLVGWPPSKGGCSPHPYRRPLDPEDEPVTPDPRGRALLEALERLSSLLVSGSDAPLALFQLSLEGFRADDVHALNQAASPLIAPFTSRLYEARTPGVLVSTKMYQAGVRTVHGLGAVMCGVGTLPYNLGFIRDLYPLEVRCVSDVLADAGFKHSFYYGSDASFDQMRTYLEGHGFSRIRSQDEMPKTLPKGTWDGLTDFAVFDQAVDDMAQALKESNEPQFSFVMSLSNHSPFTPPEDLPEEVSARVDRALKESVNRGDSDDRRRLIAYSYTDAALERLFTRLDAANLSERAIVFLAADHSTGHSFIWGPTDPESDAAKAQIPFAIVIPPAFLERVGNRKAVEAALARVQALIEEAPLSQNDVPAMMLALLRSYPPLKALPKVARWHTLGGQITSPYFRPGGEASSYVIGINGVSEFYALDRAGARVGTYEDSVFLKTRADRYRVTPHLIPVSATMIELLRCADAHAQERVAPSPPVSAQ